MVVVGAGLAGAATAYALVERGVRDVLILEKEPLAGRHASGQNAAMLRQFVPGAPAVAALAVEGARFLQAPPADLPAPLLRACGSLLLVDRVSPVHLAALADLWQRRAAAVWWPRREAQAAVPVLADAVFDGGVHCPGDGIVDVAALLRGLLDAALRGGARLRTSQEVRRVLVSRGRVQGVETKEGAVKARTIVNAAGGWASALGAAAGASTPPLQPHRRHLFVTPPLSWIDARWPYVWDLTHEFYFRPESGGLLLSACDQVPHLAGEVGVDPAVVESLAAKLLRFAPRLAEIPIRRSWAGLRTLTPDGHFVIGRDPRLCGFVWCAGLGGHGVTVSPAAGRLAAEAVLGAPPAVAHSPLRFHERRAPGQARPH